jgi:hypothetical protein
MAKIAGLGWSKTSTSKLSEAEVTERIKKTAQELWEKKGRVQGKDLEIWLEAEKLVKSGRA